MTLNQIWHELHRIALLGANQTKISEELKLALQQFGISTEASPTEILLEALATLRVLGRSAPSLMTGRNWPASQIQVEEQLICSTKSIYHLELILKGEFAAALPEFIRLLLDQKKILPPEHLPSILEKCREEPALFEQISPILGNLGWWMVAQNPSWQQLSANGILVDASAFRSQLRASWSNLNTKEQSKQLKQLEKILEEQDEALLEVAMTSSRKQVREKAAMLLVRLPTSHLAQALFDQISPYWQLNQGHTLLKLPKNIPDESYKRGIPTKTQRQYGGIKLSWFCHHVERIPPQVWLKHFDRKAGTILQLIAKSREANALIYALTGATLLHQDQEWQLALLRFFLRQGQAPYWNNDRGKTLIRQAPANHLDQIDLRGFSQLGPNAAAYFILSNTATWPKPLSISVMDEFRQTAARPSGLANLRQYFEIVAYRVWPELLVQLKEGWPRVENATTYNFTWALQKFLRTLTFRREMKTALEK